MRRRSAALSIPTAMAMVSSHATPLLQHREVELFIDLADVVLTGQHPMGIAMHHQPAVALWITGCAIKGKRFLRQTLQQSKPLLIHHRSQLHASAIMAIRPQRLCWLAMALIGCLAGDALAQSDPAEPTLQLIRGGGTPAVFSREQEPWRPASTCPVLVNRAAGEVQPLRIRPSDVALKNKVGCLSPNDAVYGADGCPLKLCNADSGVMPLPETQRP